MLRYPDCPGRGPMPPKKKTRKKRDTRDGARDEPEIKERLELVKIITRTKASVCNWEDLERQIMKGAI